MVMEDITRWILQLIKEDHLWKLYMGREWQQLRQEVMIEQHFECQDCKTKGRVVAATQVHHENEVKHRPDLALSKYYYTTAGERKRNLTCLCYACHNRRHNRFNYKPKPQLNKERW